MKRSARPLRKHTLNLYEGDYETLHAAYPRHGAAIVIRELIHRWIKEKLGHTIDDRPTAEHPRPPL